MILRPRRSALYMPGSNARALEKAKTLPADVLIFDLEDAVSPDRKIAARDQVVAALRQGGYGNRPYHSGARGINVDDNELADQSDKRDQHDRTHLHDAFTGMECD